MKIFFCLLLIPPSQVQVHSSSSYFSNAFSLCFDLRVTDQVLHPYETTGNIIVLYAVFEHLLFIQPIGKQRNARQRVTCTVENNTS